MSRSEAAHVGGDGPPDTARLSSPVQRIWSGNEQPKFGYPNGCTMGILVRMVRKNVAFKIRIDEELRRTSVEACQADDRPAAQVLREFMRTHVAERQMAISADHVCRTRHLSPRLCGTLVLVSCWHPSCWPPV